ncbi:MAG: hypothetical protein IKU24_02395, partial [Clostridia bacterium]|nr:hypothetical protein [Clostridia bacterium]
KFYGGGNSSTVISATTTISGGNFYGSISKGGKTGSVTTASLEFKLGANPIGFYGTFTLENLSGSGVIQVGKDASVTVNSAEAGNVTVEQTEYWQTKTYFTDNSGNLTLSVKDNVPGEASVVANTVVGIAPANPMTAPVGAKLVLDTKVGVKFYFNKAEVTESFTYSVVLGGKKIVSGAYADLKEEGEYLVLSFGGIGLSDFMTEFEIVSECIFDTNKAKYNTIVKLAELGAENTEVYKEKQLFWSIADLGRVAKDPDGAIHNQFLYDVTSKATGKGGEEGALLTFTGKNLYMNDAVGIRLYGRAASLEDIKNMKVIVEGDNVTRLCSISEGVLKNGAYEFTVDIFFSVLKMHDTIEIEIVDKNGKKCLTLSDQVDWIAKTILTKEPENNLAKQVLIYIQKVDRFVNEYDSGIITPPEMGGEAELGGKVEL